MRHIPGVAHMAYGHLRIPPCDNSFIISPCIPLGEAMHDRRVHQARNDAVQTDILRREHDRTCFRKLNERRLCGRVGDLVLTDIAQTRDR